VALFDPIDENGSDMMTGSLVAIVTPMREDGSLDLDAYRRLIEWHIAQGTSAIVAVGTTGESATVDPTEHIELIRVAVEAARGRVKIIAGAGANSTREAIELTTHAKRVGASASLQVVPYYNRPTQEGLYQHFRKVAESVDLPLILYNVPSRTVADLGVDTALRLSQVPGVVGIKDASGDLSRVVEMRRRGRADFAQFSGNDDSALAFILLGGQGVISVTANVAPQAMSQMCAAALAGDLARARAINERLMPLHLRLFVEPNPIPVKWALARMGRIGNGIRLPMVGLSAAAQDAVATALRDAGVE
jgi:4-hydroxy-tetrahydrodipicolinate synthase